MNALVLVESRTLEELAAAVRTEHAAAVEAGGTMVERAIRAGDALRAAKEQVERGGWERWLTAEFPELHPKTLRLYMRLSKYQVRVRAARPSTVTQAHRLLLGEAVKPADAEMREEAKRLIKGGMSQRAAARELGLSQDALRTLVDPRHVERRRARRRAESREARRVRLQKERATEAAKVGGGLAEAYSLVRKAAQALERAAAETNGDAHQAVRSAQSRLYSVEDHIAKAVRLKDIAPAFRELQEPTDV